MYKPLNQVYSESVDKTKIPLPWEKIVESFDKATRIKLYAEDPDTLNKEEVGYVDKEYYDTRLMPAIKRGDPTRLDLRKQVTERLKKLNAYNTDNWYNYVDFCNKLNLTLDDNSAKHFEQVLITYVTQNRKTSLMNIFCEAFNVTPEDVLNTNLFETIILSYPNKTLKSAGAVGEGELFLSFFGNGNKPVTGDVQLANLNIEIKKATIKGRDVTLPSGTVKKASGSGGYLFVDAWSSFDHYDDFVKQLGVIVNEYNQTQNKEKAVTDFTNIIIDIAGGHKTRTENYLKTNAMQGMVKAAVNLHFNEILKEANGIIPQAAPVTASGEKRNQPTVQQIMKDKGIGRHEALKIWTKAYNDWHKQNSGKIVTSGGTPDLIYRIAGSTNLLAYRDEHKFDSIMVFDVYENQTPVSFLYVKGANVIKVVNDSTSNGIYFTVNINPSKGGIGKMVTIKMK